MIKSYVDFLCDNPKYFLNNLKSLIITGKDAERFLNGQLTSDVKSLKANEFQHTTRLTRNGKVLSFGLLRKVDQGYIYLSEEKYSQLFKEDLEKFMIMDDVEINESTNIYSFVVDEKKVEGSLFSQPGFLIEQEVSSHSFFEQLGVLTAEPICFYEQFTDIFLNESTLNNLGVSYSKGCFLGQETVAKIENNRGAANFPMLLIGKEKCEKEIKADNEKIGTLIKSKLINEQNYCLAFIKREKRVEKLNVNGFDIQGLFSLSNRKEDLYRVAVELFQNGDEERSMKLLEYLIDSYPDFSDAYESLGVILGRNEKYEQAISYMDKLLDVNPDSIMAHTNKSLFFMKMGKIEEAEKEKSEATFKSFNQFGKDAEAKKIKEEQAKKEREELERKKGMFEQVLEIDNEDVLANFGLAEYYLKIEDFPKSLDHVEVVLNADPKYSVAYLIKGKALEFLGKKEEAKEIFKIGVEVASKKGDLMPANEMQSRLMKL
ncbi:MAG: tetratricopeptide repeat protein [Oligoflexia bacterium]|nr:tetratricopeptide repeat protein [Oligoflexia bacterium]